MGKLSLANISDQEAFERLKLSFSRLSFEQQNRQVVIIVHGQPPIVYKLGDVLAHAQKVLQGIPDIIGQLELKYAKERIAYEAGFGRKA